MQHLAADPPKKHRGNVSLACTECQKKRSKVGNIVPAILATELIYLVQCSGATPCMRCAAKGHQCLYDRASDRRRKAHTAELLTFRVALYRMAATLRSGPLEEILWLIWEIQNLPTDQDAVNHLVQEFSMLNNLGVLEVKPYPRSRWILALITIKARRVFIELQQFEAASIYFGSSRVLDITKS